MKKLLNRLDPDFISILLLLTLALIAYANSFTAPFQFDDINHIVHNEALHDLTNVGKIYSFNKTRFLTYLTLALNFKISGFDSTSYHIVNFFIHYFAALFLYFTCIDIWNTPAMQEQRDELSQRLGAFFAAGIFLLHPLQTEAVTYIVQRAESMAGMFYLAAICFYLKARLARTRKGSLGYGTLVVLAGFCAAFSKETAVTLPALIVVLEMFFFNTSFTDLVRNKMVLLLLVPAGVIVAYKLGSLMRKGFFYDPGISFTRKEYILTQFSVLVTYLRLFFWPTNQNVDWDYPLSTGFLSMKTLASFLFLIFLFVVAILLYKRIRLLSLGIIAFFITLAPTSSVIPIKDLIFEHRMYLSVAFLAMGFVHLLSFLLERVRKMSPTGHRVALSGSIITILLLITFLTIGRNEVWLSELSLWEDAVQKSPNKARPHNNYGRALSLLGNKMSERAKSEFKTAMRLDPAWALPYHNLALGYFQEGNYQRAIALDLEALKREPYSRDNLYQLGKSYKELEQWQESAVYLERLVKLPPRARFLQAHLDLLEVYLKMGFEEKALNLAENLTRVPDSLSRVNYYRGMAFYSLGDFARARFYFSREDGPKPSSNYSYLMLGQIHYLEGDYLEAEMAFRRVLENQIWSPEANYNLAVILSERKRFREASEHFEKTLAIDSFAVAPRIHLIKLYGQLDDSAKRLEHTRKLLGLRPDSEEFSFLKDNGQEDLNQTLSSYQNRFLSQAVSPSADKTLALIATLRNDYRDAIARYKSHLQTLTQPEKKDRILNEVHRLEGILSGKEPLRTPA